MEYIDDALSHAISDISSEQNCEQLFAFYSLWFNIRQSYPETPSDPIVDDIWTGSRRAPDENIRTLTWDNLIHPTTHWVLRFTNSAESDHTLAPHNTGLQTRLCKKILREFFIRNLQIAPHGPYVYNKENTYGLYTDASLIAHWVNLGYVEEAAIRNHILQSLISHPYLYDHQADALYILFKVAGATFEAYAETSVVDRCFELLKGHRHSYRRKGELISEVIKLRELNWAGLPPPPIIKTGKPKPTHADEKDLTATPVATSLGLPKGDFEPQVSHQPPLESAAGPETDTAPTPPVTHSPSISVSTLSDFTVADTSDDEFPIDPTKTAPHGTFYLEDGNVEVLCGNTLFRVHTSILSFQSLALRRIFSQASLASAESPNGCPRILSSDTATDFATLLKMIYFLGFPEWNKVPDFATFSSLLRITAKYELPTVRSQLLEVVRDAYPETFQGLAPSKPLGESIFGGPTPHPNEVLNLFVQQKLISTLPMAHYMAARRGLDSLMDRRLPQSATLPPDILQSAIRGLMALREMERDETHRLIFEPNGSRRCPTCALTGPVALQAYQKVFDHIVGSSQLGTRVLQVPEFYEDCEGGSQCVSPGVCSGCVERWKSGHADLRKKAWARLPDVFGLKG